MLLMSECEWRVSIGAIHRLITPLGIEKGVILALVFLLAACGDNDPETVSGDGSATSDAQTHSDVSQRNSETISGEQIQPNLHGDSAQTVVYPSSQNCSIAPSTAPAPILLQNINIIDGLGTEPMPMRDVLIVGGCIKKIAVTGMIGELPKNTQVLTGEGLTVFPGLIDAHTHIGRVGFERGELMRADLDGMDQYLRATLYGGVTTILEVGSGNQSNSVLLRDKINAGERLGPTIYTAGSTINALKTTQEGVRQLTSPDTQAEISKLLDDRQNDGIDIIKLYAGLTHWEARHIMTAAKKRGMKGVADLWCSNLSRTSFEITLVDAFAHGRCRKLTKEEAQWIAANDKFAMITFAAFDAMGGHRAFTDYPDRGFLKNPLIVDIFGEAILEQYYRNFHQIREQITEGEHSLYRSQLFGDVRRLVPDNYANVRLLFEEGALIGMGTDAPFPPGSFPGEAMHFELEHHVKAGIPPVKAIQFATLNNAVFLDVANEIGSVETGKIADLVIVRGDPSMNISDTRNIEYVLKGGDLIDRAALKREQ